MQRRNFKLLFCFFPFLYVIHFLMSSHPFPAESRIGRKNQVYDKDNIRQIAGTVAVDPKTNRVLVISSSKHKHVWVLPKGGWENDETIEQSAEREAYEEGGIRGKVKSFIGSFIDHDGNGNPKSKIHFYEFEVQAILDHWPEKDFRQRRWCHLDEALSLLTHKPLMKEALLASSFGSKL
ncbi:NUDIX hydrolase domain-like protein [Blakeslea trispora]|nr:NUDIX hydrolase domain-like protein [Blakeslea trispora]